ncbi:hypothetical protein KEJ25_01970 [Candidatus Bathyarchaeota archaeon]|nr:hypothetical protein [Candidatus Bathyarchaeota archaeon]
MKRGGMQLNTSRVLLALTLTVIWSIFGAILTIVLGSMHGYTSYDGFALSTTTTLLALYVVGSYRRTVSVETYVSILIALSSSTIVCSFWSFSSTFVRSCYIRIMEPYRTLFGVYMPYFWAPEAETINSMLLGGKGFPILELTPSIVFWICLTVFSYIFLIGSALVFRDAFLEIEKLSFPHTQIYLELMPYSSMRRFSKGTFKAGLLFVLILQVPYVIRQAVPWFPVVPINWGQVFPFTVDFSEVREIREVYLPNSVLTFGYNPWHIALAYLAPMDTTLSIWLSFLLLQVVYPALATWMGIMPMNTSRVTFQSARNWRWINLMYGPLKPYITIGVGGLIGIGIWPIILDLAFRGGRRVFLERTGLLSILLGAAGLSYLAYLSNSPPSQMLIGLLVLQSIALGLARIRGELGLLIPPLSKPLNTAFWYRLYPWKTMDSSYFAYLHIFGGIYSSEAGVSFMSIPSLSMETLKTMKSWKIEDREGFYILSLASIIVASTTYFLVSLELFNTYGVSAFPGSKRLFYETVKDESDFLITAVSTYPPWPWWQNIVSGLLGIGIIMMLGFTFPWFPITPEGLVISSTEVAMQGFWSSCLIAWILKKLTFAVGGAYLYERDGKSMALGVILGYILTTLLSILISLILVVYH